MSLFGPKKTFIRLDNPSERNLITYSGKFVLDRGTTLEVPPQYTAVVFINGKPLLRRESGLGQELLALVGKQAAGQTVQVAYVRTKALAPDKWGVGNINVNNARLNEAYRVGANGTYTPTVCDYVKLVNAFPYGEDVTLDDVHERVLSVIQGNAAPVIAKQFADSNVSVFEMVARMAEIRAEIQSQLKLDSALSSMGIRLDNVVVAGMHINQEDLERIRDRINNGGVIPGRKDDDGNSGGGNDGSSKIIRFSEEMYRRFAEENGNLKNDLVAAVIAQLTAQLQEFGRNIVSEIDERIQETLPLQDAAKADHLRTLDVTAEFLIAHAKNDDDLIPPAAMLYSNVEDNLIHKFGLQHKDQKFLIDYDEYLAIAETTMYEGRNLLKRRNKDGSISVLQPRVYSTTADGKPCLVEMFPVVRFVKAGLSVEDAKHASDIWTTLNRIRHKSDENNKLLEQQFERDNISRKDYLTNALEFFKQRGLYTM